LRCVARREAVDGARLDHAACRVRADTAVDCVGPSLNVVSLDVLMPAAPSFFKRFLLPGSAFKAVVIGGGYASGRELAEFFLPSGPWGGLLGMLLAMACWSIVCAATFVFARRYQARD